MRNIPRTMAVGLLATLFAACGGEDGPPNGDGDGNGNGGDGNGGPKVENPFERDTSDYDGLLYWSRPSRSGFAIWDLKPSRYLWQMKSENILENQMSLPFIAADADVLAQTVGKPYALTATIDEVRVYELGKDTYTAFPTDGLAEKQIRLSMAPTLSADGRYVAAIAKTVTFEFVEEVNGDLPTHETKWGVEIWDRETGTRTDLPGEEDRWPLIAEDASTVTFVSRRDSKHGDFYRASLSSLDTVERMNVLDHDELREIYLDQLPPEMSADGRWVVFVGELEGGGTAAFLLDTTDKSVVRISGSAEDVGVASISADGSTVSWGGSVGEFDDSVSPPVMRNYAVIAKRDATSVPLTTIDDFAGFVGPMALSRDGRSAAFVTLNLFDTSLVVMNSDGSNRRVVATTKDDENILYVGSIILRFR